MNIQLDDFIQFLSVRQLLEPRTIGTVISRYAIICEWLKKRQLSFDRQSIEKFLFELKQTGLKNNSINSYIIALRHVWYYCKDRNIRVEDFAGGIKILPHHSPPIEILTQEEIESLINVVVPYGRFRKFSSDEMTISLNNLYRPFTRFLSRTGARFEEAALLCCRFVDLSAGKITFLDITTKNKLTRSVWITEPLISELRSLIEGKKREDLVFTNFLGSRVIPQNYDLHLHRAAKLAGITKKVHPHIFRHSFATELYAATKDIGLVQLVLGHKDIKSTMIYVHLADETIKKGLYRHPYNRKHIEIKDYIGQVEEAIDAFKLYEDERFDYGKVKQVTAKFLAELHKAVNSSQSSGHGLSG